MGRTVAVMGAGAGGHVRIGLEDNLKCDHTRLADSNAALMAQVVAFGAQDARYPATPAEARLILRLSGLNLPAAA